MSYPGPQVQPMSAAISDGVNRVVVDYVGRGANRIRTTIVDDMVITVMRDTFIKAERKLLDTGQGGVVRDLRLRFQQTMREDLTAVVTSVTGRRVEAFLSDHHLDPDIAVETFLLFPADADGHAGAVAPSDVPDADPVS